MLSNMNGSAVVSAQGEARLVGSETLNLTARQLRGLWSWMKYGAENVGVLMPLSFFSHRQNKQDAKEMLVKRLQTRCT